VFQRVVSAEERGAQAVYKELLERSAAAKRFTVIVLGVVVLGVSMAISRAIVLRIHRLGVSVRRVADGNLETSFDSTSPDELGRLAEGLNQMVASIRGALGH